MVDVMMTTILYSPALPVKGFAASLGALRALVKRAKARHLCLLNAGREVKVMDGIGLVEVMTTILYSPALPVKGFAVSLGTLAYLSITC